MKKSIKYAGIAAATLLTVAPIAAPVVSNVTTVKADASDAQTSASQLNTAIKDFKDLYGDQSTKDYVTAIADTDTAAAMKLGADNALSYKDFVASPQAKLLSKDNVAPTLNDLLNANTNTNDANVRNVYIQASTPSNSNITNTTDLFNILNDKTQPEVTFVLHFTYTDTNGATQTDSKTFKATRDDDADITSLKATFTTPMSVAKNTTVTDSQLVSNADVTIKDQNNDGITTGTITPVAKYYTTYAAAMNNDGTTGLADTDTVSTDTPAKFKKAGTLYQPITVTAASGTDLNQFIADYEKTPSDNPVYVNGKLASANYDVKAATDDSTKATTLTFVRTINVSDSEAQWTTTDKAGVVTTKNGSAYYTLKDDEGNTITNRALAKNTDWATDKVRTDQNGNKQYRVATGEWIDANDVTFSEKGDNNNNAEGAYTDVQALNGKVTLDGPSSFIYMLYNDNGASVSNRALAGNSEWYTDKKATNAAGQTVYHVATGEWVQAGSGVNYVAY